ncbi:MAG: amidohydrolase family protein [Candidatus Rokubacteria bacterium]|nr:amidohydrolase family protein [Candidatus Rokubacteria bacterium]
MRVDLSALPVVDGHCHPLRPDPWTLSPREFLDLFSEGRPGSMAPHIPSTLYYRRALRELAEGLECEETPEAILDRRKMLGAAEATRRLSASRVGALLVDTGYPSGAMPLAEMRRLLPCAVHEVFRIESCAEALLPKALPYGEFLDAFRQEVSAASSGSVAFKSIIAYRSGLAVREWPAPNAEAAYRAAVARVRAGGTARLTEKPLLDSLCLLALTVATETGLPFQVHAGIGDPDIELPQANPLFLQPILEDGRWDAARIVILHLAYPYLREAAFMAAVWPQVFVDLSLALPLLGAGAALPLVEVLSLAPASKLMYGSDLGALPEFYALSADWARATLGEALGWLVERDQCRAEDARVVGGQILADNARRLYALPIAFDQETR